MAKADDQSRVDSIERPRDVNLRMGDLEGVRSLERKMEAELVADAEKFLRAKLAEAGKSEDIFLSSDQSMERGNLPGLYLLRICSSRDGGNLVLQCDAHILEACAGGVCEGHASSLRTRDLLQGIDGVVVVNVDGGIRATIKIDTAKLNEFLGASPLGLPAFQVSSEEERAVQSIAGLAFRVRDRAVEVSGAKELVRKEIAEGRMPSAED